MASTEQPQGRIGEYDGVSYTTDGGTGHQRLVTPQTREGPDTGPYGGWAGGTPIVAESVTLPDGSEPGKDDSDFLGRDDNARYRVTNDEGDVRIERLDG